MQDDGPPAKRCKTKTCAKRKAKQGNSSKNDAPTDDQLVVENGAPADHQVVENGAPADQQVVENGAPAGVENGVPAADQPVLENGAPAADQLVVENGAPAADQPEVENGAPAEQAVDENGAPPHDEMNQSQVHGDVGEAEVMAQRRMTAAGP